MKLSDEIKYRTKQADEMIVDGRLTAKNASIKPCLVYENDSADRIIKKLKKEKVNDCIIVSKDKGFIGEISDKDLINLFFKQVKKEPLVKALNHGYRRDFFYKKAREMMNEHKSIVKKDTPINEVIELMKKENFRYIPMLDDKDKVTGVITPSSLINLLRNY
ncbi:MAG: CBS domain-containing protein [Nanobdellota archaeon]